jgi:hypothetical protein
MQATHGYADSFRSRGRLVGLLMVLVLALGALVFAPAANAVNAPETDSVNLGDSLAFGYTQEKFELNFPTESPAAFEEGYTHFFNKKLRASSKKFGEMLQGLVEINLGCPGETTDSMIGNGPLGAAIDPTGESPCGYHKAGFPLHTEYFPGTSQLETAVGEIGLHAGKVKAVTLNIGSNDELAAVHKCEAEVKTEFETEGKSKYGSTPEEAVTVCIASGAKATFEHIIGNIGASFFVIDEGSKFGGVNYTGPIVLGGFYNPDSFVLPGSDQLQSSLNAALVATFFTPTNAKGEPNPNFVPNATFGNPFPKINVRKPASEKANIAKYTEMCNKHDQEVNEAKAGHPLPECDGDIHPTKAGYELLGKVFYSAYNPAL